MCPVLKLAFVDVMTWLFICLLTSEPQVTEGSRSHTFCYLNWLVKKFMAYRQNTSNKNELDKIWFNQADNGTWFL